MCWFVWLQNKGFLPYVRSASNSLDGSGGDGNGGCRLRQPIRSIPSEESTLKSKQKLKKPKANYYWLQILCSSSVFSILLRDFLFIVYLLVLIRFIPSFCCLAKTKRSVLTFMWIEQTSRSWGLWFYERFPECKWTGRCDRASAFGFRWCECVHVSLCLSCLGLFFLLKFYCGCSLQSTFQNHWGFISLEIRTRLNMF